MTCFQRDYSTLNVGQGQVTFSDDHRQALLGVLCRKNSVAYQPMHAHRANLQAGSGFRLRQPARAALDRRVVRADPRAPSVTLDTLTRPGLAAGGANAGTIQDQRNRAIRLHFTQRLDDRLQFAGRQLAAAESTPSTQLSMMTARPLNEQ